MGKRLLFSVGVLVLLFGCRKDQIVQTPLQSTTPVAFPQPSNFPKASLPADNPLTKEGIKLGRHLFFEKRLSGDNSQSCGSCHFQENNFADPRQFSVGIDGSIGDRNAMILSNLAWQSFFFWDGREQSMEDQALKPVENPIEMKSHWPDVIEKLKADPYYQTYVRGRDLSNEDWYSVLTNRPGLLRCPVALYRNKAILCETPSDVLKVIGSRALV